MIKVQIATLKDSLSAYLKKVLAGSEILITDRNKPIAKIVPLGRENSTSLDEHLASLANSGMIEVNFSAKTLPVKKRIKLPVGVSASAIILKDRNE